MQEPDITYIQAIEYLSDLHGEDYRKSVDCMEDALGLQEDIRRGRLALTEEEYSPDQHAQASAAVRTLIKHYHQKAIHQS